MYPHVDWERYMTFQSPMQNDDDGGQSDPNPHQPSTLQPPPRMGNRTICPYLKQESEYDGMRVYIDGALSRWYGGLLEYRRQVDERRRRSGEDQEEKTLFVCYEDFNDPARQEDVFYEMVDFLFPGDRGRGDDDDNRHFLTIPESPQEERYSGPHSTNPDVELRRRLEELVRELDRDIFNGTLASIDRAYRCGGGGGGSFGGGR